MQMTVEQSFSVLICMLSFISDSYIDLFRAGKCKKMEWYIKIENDFCECEIMRREIIFFWLQNFRCGIGLHRLYLISALGMATLHHVWDSIFGHVNHQRIFMFGYDLLLREIYDRNRKRTIYHWRVWSIHEILAWFAIWIKVRNAIIFCILSSIFELGVYIQ